MRVLVTGSRTWKDHQSIHHALDTILADHPEMVLVHGACKQGADAIADRWAALRGIPEERIDRHPAEWRKLRKRAGFVRNEHMVSLGAGVCLAFIDQCAKPDCDNPEPHGSHGAIHCATAAIKAGIPTVPLGPGARELTDLLNSHPQEIR